MTVESDLKNALERASLVAVMLFASTRELRMDTTEDERLRNELLALARRVIPSIDRMADDMGVDQTKKLLRDYQIRKEENAD